MPKLNVADAASVCASTGNYGRRQRPPRCIRDGLLRLVSYETSYLTPAGAS